MKQQIKYIMGIMSSLTILVSNAQNSSTGIGTNTPDKTAVLDISSTTKGFLPPRMTQAQRNAIPAPAKSLMVFCTDCLTNGSISINRGTSGTPIWENLSIRNLQAELSSLDCLNPIVNKTLIQDITSNQVVALIPYNGGNGRSYSTGNSIASSGVTGLNAILREGTLSRGAGVLVYEITGTPTSSGTATFTLSDFGSSCNFSIPVISPLSKGCITELKLSDYNTIISNVTGSYKEWITQNLGSYSSPSSGNDNSDVAAGCYYQFNRSTAFGHDNGSTVNPNWIITSISESFDWQSTNDPCRTQLGISWRLPTASEWSNIDINNGWNNLSDTFSSDLKLHASGYLNASDGSLADRSISGHYWSSNQSSNTEATSFNISDSVIETSSISVKAVARTIRCIKD